MNFSKFIISLSLLLFCTLFVKAQDNDKYIYSDSTVEENTVTEAATDADYSNEYVMDSILYFHYVTYAVDSNKALKSSPQLRYIQNLDSLLIALKKQEEVTPEKKENTNNWFFRVLSSKITRYIFWGMAIIFIIFILSKLFFTKGFFQRNTRRSKVNLIEEESESVSAFADYDKLIGQALKDNNYRLAVRYLYLQTLQKLSENGQIEYAEDKTNYQYVRELTGKSYVAKFASLTLNYEYVWYGEFNINEEAFNNIYSDFKNFNSQL